MVKYVYDAWGNHKVLNPNGTENTAEDFIGNINPIRYRSYYFDTETGLYYLNARYYDPETCRFISPDSVDYLDPETIGGTNLYAYCNNNPVMNVDPTGHDWWHWLLAIGAVIVVAAATVLTCGAAGIAIGGAGLAGAVIHGAAVGALIGAGIGAAGGAVAGGIYSAVTGADFWTSVGIGAAAGFGIGAIVGAIVGGFAGANGWYNAKALEFTNFGSNEVVLGRSPRYVEIAKGRGATYFHTSDDIWNATKAMKGVGNKGMWRINKAFLKQQIKSGAQFILTEPSSGFFYAKEVAYIIKHGIYTFL